MVAIALPARTRDEQRRVDELCKGDGGRGEEAKVSEAEEEANGQ